MRHDLNPHLWPLYIHEMLDGAGSLGAAALEHLAAPGYAPRYHVIPDYSSASVVGAGKFEARLTLPQYSYIWAWTGSSNQTEGFAFNAVDQGTDTPFLAARTLHKALTGQSAVGGVTFPLMILSPPRLLLRPALLRVQVENLSASAASIQLVLWTAEPQS